ncbi:hypothetical protein BD309DRAFT_971820, partial [Dichomitus squalens]
IFPQDSESFVHGLNLVHRCRKGGCSRCGPQLLGRRCTCRYSCRCLSCLRGGLWRCCRSSPGSVLGHPTVRMYCCCFMYAIGRRPEG